MLNVNTEAVLPGLNSFQQALTAHGQALSEIQGGIKHALAEITQGVHQQREALRPGPDIDRGIGPNSMEPTIGFLAEISRS